MTGAREADQGLILNTLQAFLRLKKQMHFSDGTMALSAIAGEAAEGGCKHWPLKRLLLWTNQGMIPILCPARLFTDQCYQTAGIIAAPYQTHSIAAG